MENKVVMITGASSGIGEALLYHFIDIGYRKFSILARRKELLESVAEKAKAKSTDVKVLPLVKDLLKVEDCRVMVKRHFMIQI